MDNQKEKYLNILEALYIKENKLLLESSFRAKLFKKLLIFREFLKGQTNFSQAFWSIAPEALRPTKALNEGENDLDINITFHHLFGYYPHEPVNLLDHRIYYFLQRKITKREKYLCFLGLIEFIKAIVISDQYCIRDFIKNDSVIIDAGANIGVFSLFVNSLFPNSKIYSFEPNSRIFNMLQKNIFENNLTQNVCIYQKALGDMEGKSELLRSKNVLETSSSVVNSGFTKGRAMLFSGVDKIEMITIDSFIKENNIQKVDFIKIDTEGYEKQIIKGAKNTIQHFLPIISCSAYHLENDKTKIPELVKSINPNYKFKLVNRAEEDLIFWV